MQIKAPLGAQVHRVITGSVHRKAVPKGSCHRQAVMMCVGEQTGAALPPRSPPGGLEEVLPFISETVLPSHLQSLQWEGEPVHTCQSECTSLPSGPHSPHPPSPSSCTPLTSLVLCRHLASMSYRSSSTTSTLACRSRHRSWGNRESGRETRNAQPPDPFPPLSLGPLATSHPQRDLKRLLDCPPPHSEWKPVVFLSECTCYRKKVFL